MSDYDEFDDDNGSGLIKDLRQQIKELKAERDNAVKQVTEFKTLQRSQSVASLLEARGVKPGVAKFIPDDVEGAEALDAWLQDNGELFGLDLQPGQPNVDPAVVESSRRITELSSSATPTKIEDLQTRIASASSAEELDSLWREAQQYSL